MQEIFTEEVRTLMRKSAEFSVRSQEKVITPDSLLRAMLSFPESMAYQILVYSAIDVEKLAHRMDCEIFNQTSPTDIGTVDFSQSVKDAIEFSFEGARKLGHQHINTEHILYGLLRYGNFITHKEWLEREILPPSQVLEFCRGRERVVLKSQGFIL